MFKVSHSVIRADDQLLAKFTFVPETRGLSLVELGFWSESHPIEIAGSTVGHISDNKVLLKKVQIAEVLIPYNNKPIECRMSYIDDNNLVASKTEIFVLEQRPSVQTAEKENPVISFGGTSFENRMSNIQNVIGNNKSKWQLKLSVSDHVVVQVLRYGAKPITVCFGEPGHELSFPDFIFTVYPQNYTFVIPVELINKNRKMYGSDRLSVFELIKPDFHKIPDIYYKRIISNSIDIGSNKQKVRELSYFSSPVGEPLTGGWIIKNNLPVKNDL